MRPEKTWSGIRMTKKLTFADAKFFPQLCIKYAEAAKSWPTREEEAEIVERANARALKEAKEDFERQEHRMLIDLIMKKYGGKMKEATKAPTLEEVQKENSELRTHVKNLTHEMKKLTVLVDSLLETAARLQSPAMPKK